MPEDWLERWAQGRTGWHEASGNAALRRHWRWRRPGGRVLVPLCGKTVDLLWLEALGLEVTGVELSPIAIEAFFRETRLAHDRERQDPFGVYRARGKNIALYCGDYFAFDGGPFDALYDRGSLVAFPESDRPGYVMHTGRLLKPGAFRLLITLDYDQSRVSGPPFSVRPEEVRRFWPGLCCVEARNDIENGPPKFREAGLNEVTERVWRAPVR